MHTAKLWNNSDYGLKNYGIQETSNAMSLIITTMKLIQCSELNVGQSTYTYKQNVSLCKLWKPKSFDSKSHK